MALTVRLDPKTERALNALAKRRHQTRSDIVREALEQYAATGDDGASRQSAFEQWADVLGTVKTPGRAVQKTTGQLFTEIVVKKHRARRSR